IIVGRRCCAITLERAPNMLHLAADPAQLRKDRFGECAPFVQETTAVVGDPVELLRAFGFDDRRAELFEIGQRGIYHHWARAVKAARTLLQCLDNFIPVTRLFFEQRQDHELQIVGTQLSPGAKPVNAASPTADHAAEEPERTCACARTAVPRLSQPSCKSMMHHRLLRKLSKNISYDTITFGVKRLAARR